MANQTLSNEEILELLEEDNDMDVSDYESSDDEGEIDHVSDASMSDSELSVDDVGAGVAQVTPTISTPTNLLSKNKLENWNVHPPTSPAGRTANHNIVTTRPGPTRYARSCCSSVIDSFMLYLRQNLLDTIRKWTNQEGQLVYEDRWKEIEDTEFKKFIGIMILIGVYKSKNESILQLWNKDHGRPIFNQIMSRNRYLTILQVLRFDNAQRRRAHRSLDKLQPIREVFESWVSYLQDSYTPGTCMTVDEQLVPFRGRCPFRQYIPSKPGKYGMKIWTICDAASYYTWKMQVYTGKDERIGREVNQGTRVVLDMVKEIEKTGRNITCDNFFTSLSLARQLLSKKLTLVGTMRKNKPELPPEFTKTRGREVMSTLFGFQKNAMIALYCPKKNAVVNMLSTMHNQPDVDENSEKKKPDVILCYNETKSGVDIVDKMVKTYSTKRMSRRWPLTLFYNMVDVSALNAFIVWQELNGKNSRVTVKQRRAFLLQLSSELAELVSEIHTGTSSANNPQQSSRKRHVPPESGDASALPPKKGRCWMCDRCKDRKTKTICSKCQKNVCGEHSNIVCRHCFQL